MRILIVSYSPLKQGGLNRAVKALGPLLRARGYTVGYGGIGHEGCPQDAFDFQIWPIRPVRNGNLLEVDWAWVNRAVKDFEPDRMLLLGDVWAYRNLVTWRMSRRDNGQGWPPALLWLTIDSAPFPYRFWTEGVLDIAEQLACTTMFGCRVLAGESCAPWPIQRLMRYQADYLPLGIDPQVFRPDGQMVQRDDRFWIGWCGRNDARKRAPDALRTLRVLLDRGVDAALWMRTNAAGEDTIFDLTQWAQQFGLRLTHGDPNKVAADVYVIGDTNAGAQPLTDAALAAWYRSLDVLLHTSAAGAPELPILEARGCGTPVVAVDGYSNPETADVLVPHCGSVGLTLQGTLETMARPEDYAGALLAARGMRVTNKLVPSWELTADMLDDLLQAPVPDGPVGMVI